MPRAQLFRDLRPPGSWRDELARFAATLPADTVMAEVGSFAGESAEIFCASGRVQTLYCIDPWSEELQTFPPAAFMAEAEKRFDERTRNLPVVKLKACSVEAVDHIPDGSLDVVYIDGDHRYESVKADLLAFLPKLKAGGWMCGHDYWLADVAMAVTELFGRLPDELYGDGQPVGTWVYKTVARGTN